jgi:hypothetical protein
MNGIFDRLQNEIETSRQERGITMLDLAELSPALRKIMRVMLRELKMNYPGLCATMDSLPVDQRLSQADLDDALDSLTRQFWLTRIGNNDESAIYKINLRRRSGSSLPQGLWGLLDGKIKGK